jgi:hypothetical protein
MAMQNIQQREQFLNSVAISRLKILNAIAEHRATPWHKKAAQEDLPNSSQEWYRSYQEAIAN